MFQHKLFIESINGFIIGDVIKIKNPLFECEKDLELRIIKIYRKDYQIGARNMKVEQSYYVLSIDGITKV